ncbi:hypothetical protein GOARA_021_00910 [Gordonia araii NBRC 100433]|uniref:DUF4878 domain-containing protein n=1 Tax=Gordonia araii NBRC 100433 TaxID=1073574 RepID=G7GZ29_9ACTN|nr:hypothetical protein [Gordonia araii]NNG97062.1 hypothetical protein [Gordonia araii NBRC 100433]GAB08854.1 hypothetical protein GOARA_021_00910 [Gordonia araii NBRC 100433]
MGFGPRPGYGAPPGHPPFPPPPPPPRKPRRPLTIALAITAVVVLLGGAAGAVYFFAGGFGDEKAIKQITADFSRAVAQGDTGEMTKLLCKSEAQHVQADLEATDDESDAQPEKFEIAAVEVKDDVARAQLTFTSDGRTSTLFFRREERRWTVCSDAETAFGP